MTDDHDDSEDVAADNSQRVHAHALVGSDFVVDFFERVELGQLVYDLGVFRGFGLMAGQFFEESVDCFGDSGLVVGWFLGKHTVSFHRGSL